VVAGIDSTSMGVQSWEVNEIGVFKNVSPSGPEGYLQEYVNYRMPGDGNIQDVWTDVQRLDRNAESVTRDERVC
jgi:hypothetical protein